MQNSGVMVSAGKAFTDPLLILLLVMAVSLVVGFRRARGNRGVRKALGVALFALLLLALLSTSFVAALLEHSLMVESPSNAAPDVIVVASGGSHGQALRPSTMNRIVAGIAWWKEHRKSRLILAGVDTLAPGETSTRTLLLMREVAISRGVPPAAITLETKSTNTREHPLRLRELPGITPQLTIGVVTSGWHMRRTQRAFQRSFPRVVSRVADRPGDAYWIVNDVIPSANDLADSTVLLHEWIGVAWYALRG